MRTALLCALAALCCLSTEQRKRDGVGVSQVRVHSWNESVHAVNVGEDVTLCAHQHTSESVQQADYIALYYVFRPENTVEEYLRSLRPFTHGSSHLSLDPGPWLIDDEDIWRQSVQRANRSHTRLDLQDLILVQYMMGPEMITIPNHDSGHPGLTHRMNSAELGCVVLTRVTTDDVGYYVFVVKPHNETAVATILRLDVLVKRPRVTVSASVFSATEDTCVVVLTCKVSGLTSAGRIYFGDKHDGITATISAHHYYNTNIRFLHSMGSTRHHASSLGLSLVAYLSRIDAEDYHEDYLTYECHFETGPFSVNASVEIKQPCLDYWYMFGGEPTTRATTTTTTPVSTPTLAPTPTPPPTPAPPPPPSGPTHWGIVLFVLMLIFVIAFLAAAHVLGWLAKAVDCMCWFCECLYSLVRRLVNNVRNFFAGTHKEPGAEALVDDDDEIEDV